MNNATTKRRVLAVLFAVVMLLSVTIVGTLAASAEETVVAKIGDVEYTSLQTAIDAAADGETTITLVADCAENVTVMQSQGKNIVIDGNDKTFTGTLYVNGNKRSSGKETLLVKNLNFVLSGSYGIAAHTTKNTFPHNITVEGCSFTGTGSGYGIYLRHAYNIVVKDTKATDLYDFAYAVAAVTGFTAENVEITNCTYGLVFGFGTGIDLSGVSMDGVADASILVFNRTGGATMKLTDCDLDKPVVFGSEGATGSMKIELDHTNVEIDVDANADKLDIKLDDETSNVKIVTDNVAVNDEEGKGVTITCEEGVHLEPNEDGSYGKPLSAPVASVNGVEYPTIQDAINAADDGETVVVLADHTIDLIDRDHFIGLETGKSITLDLNGKQIFANAHDIKEATGYVIVFHVMSGSLTVTDSVGGGKMHAEGEDTLLAYMFRNDSTLVVENGIFELSAVTGGAMFFSINSNMTVKGGEFAQLTTGWMFNTSGNGVGNIITVEGGTYNRDFMNPVKDAEGNYNENPWGEVVLADGYKLVDNGNGTWSVVVEAIDVAELNGVKYTDLQAAIDAAVDGDVITLIADINLDGSTAKNGGSFGYDNLYLIAGKKITIDFGGHYINVTPETRGEANAVAPSYENLIISVIFVNDGAGLTLTGNGGIKTFDAAKMMYCLVYNNNATVNVESGEYIGNVYDSMFYGDGDHVTNINGGNFEILNLADYDPSGSLRKPWVINTSGKNNTYVNFTGGTFNYNININYTIPGCNYDKEINISDGYKLVDNGDGTWSVEFDGFIKIGDVKYDTLAEAIAAVKNGETIDLLGDCAETVIIKQTSGLSFTINGNGNNYTGTIVINGNNGYTRSESLTIKNINFVTENTTHNFINANSYNGSKLSNSHNVTVDNCTFTGPEGNNSVQALCVRTANKLTISNCTATNVMYLVQSTSGGLDLQVINCVVDASYGVRVHNGNKALIKDSTFTTLSYAIIFDAYTDARSATLENVTINAENGNSAIYLNNKTTVGTLTLNLNGENEFIGKWLQIAGTGATLKVASENVADLDLDKAVYGSDYRVYVGAELYVFTERAVTFTGAQLNLGNSFGIYYNVTSSTIYAGIDYVAIVTDADGKVVAEIPSSEWVNGNKILYSGLAAKQMSDEFTVEVKYNGEVVSLAPVTTSIKSYVARGIENNVFDEETLALLTAMLNYGAVAQDSFNYNEDDLANTVVAGQPVVNVPVDNNTVAGADYYGASLNLESNIIFNFKFRQDQLDGVEVAGAIVSYVNNDGETVKVELEVGTETTTKFPKDLYVVKFSTFIPADAAQLFTCELVDSEGNVVASAQDGILSYCARAIEGLSAMHPADYNGRQFKIEFYQAIANYIVACSNYAN